MANFRIEYERSKCIGAASCAAIDSEHFKMNPDGKADLNGGSKKGNVLVLELDDVKKAQPAAQSCPANAIRIIDLKTNKKLV
jgi:ferredoxin